MKKTSLSVLFVLAVMLSFAQSRTPASSCSNCYQVSVTARNNRGCGGSSDYTYTVTNNTNQPLDIVLFVEKLDGTWRDLGLLTSASSGAVKKDAFWACNITGRYLLYYRVAGSNDKFPTAREINANAN